ncbi:hypothetical protein C0585_02205 [Candidatus Woesearchaeota archaeon]|nr:MAG: hypothetical protein C0585_02205 [Candidatus Woesearchaeota archaeon]
MKIMYKMLIGFFIVVAISLISGITSINFINTINEDVTFVQEEEYPENTALTNYLRGANNLWVGTYIYANGDTAMGNQYIRNGKRIMKESRLILASGDDIEVDIDSLKKKEDSAIEASDKVLNGIKSGASSDEISLNLNFLQQRVASLDLALSGAVEESQEELLELLEDSKEQSNNVVNLNKWSLIISVGLSLLVAVLISLLITKPLKKLSDAADKLTSGEDVAVPEIKTHDEIEKLGNLMQMQSEIIKMMKMQQQQAPAKKTKSKK